jgi:hypothetical protein
MRLYRAFSLALAVIFAAVGLSFLLMPARVIGTFNALSPAFGLDTVPAAGFNFYLILAVGYMYLVTLLAVFMYLDPDSTVYPLLLSHGKIASSVLSFALFAFHRHFLLYAGNGVVDGCIGVVVLIIYLHKKRAAW